MWMVGGGSQVSCCWSEWLQISKQRLECGNGLELEIAARMHI